MADIVIFASGFGFGAFCAWLALRDEMKRLADITDRDARGRFVKRDK